MPLLIEHIDAIARQKQRDVLYVAFRSSQPVDDDWDSDADYDWKSDPVRQSVCEWLTEHQIAWQYCAEIADENYMGPYRGSIYLDVPFDEDDALYQQVRNYLENPDGSMRFPTATFYYLPLEKAMENAHHDEPGFWEKWAEDF